jgi:hypothetical protein
MHASFALCGKVVECPQNKSEPFFLELQTTSAAAPHYKPLQACTVLMDFRLPTLKKGTRSGAVVEALLYKPEGRGIDSR